MARIKQILNERRIAYEQAYALGYRKQQMEKRATDADLFPQIEELSVQQREPKVEDKAVHSSVVHEQARILS